MTATDGVFDYYLHLKGSSVVVSGGVFGEHVIHSVSISSLDQACFEGILRRLDSTTDLDFRQVSSAAKADLDLYYDI